MAGVSTWRDRRPDHVVSSAFTDISQTIGPPDCPWANLTVRSDLQDILAVDHAPLVCETFFRGSPARLRSKDRRRLRAAFFKLRPCRMVFTDDAPLQSFVYKHLHHAAHSPGSVYASLKSIVPTCSRPLASRRYVDPPAIKDLCRHRSLCVCPVERKHYNFQIYRLRAEARKQWHQILVHDAAMGDWSSKKLLQPRRPLPVALRPLLDKHHGDHASIISTM